jgi:transcriptional regulator with XRE-family HTH domain
MDESQSSVLPLGFPELTELGKRIEVLRIERGISKQHLARYAGTSRQQLWRVMTGKSEMSLALRARLADVLHVGSLQNDNPRTASASSAFMAPIVVEHQTSSVSSRVRETSVRRTATQTESVAMNSTPSDLRAYLADVSRIARTFASMPTGEHGRALKRRFLDAIEDVAMDAGIELDHTVFELRRKVLSGHL